MPGTPIVSIVLPVFNASNYITQSIQSILDQRGLFDYQVIIVDDGSTDDSVDIIERMADSRFVIIRRRSNHGLVAALNLGINRADAELIARMDADDIMDTARLANQVQFMLNHPFLAVSGTYFDYIDQNGEPAGGAINFPVQPDDVKEAFKTYTAIGHPTAIFRKSMLMQHTKLYSDKYKHAEDLALWLECLSKGLLFANLPNVLLHYRVHPGQVSRVKSATQQENTALARRDFGHLIWRDTE